VLLADGPFGLKFGDCADDEPDQKCFYGHDNPPWFHTKCSSKPGRYRPALRRVLPTPAAAITIMMVVMPTPRGAATMMMAIPIAIVMIAANARMNADAANMDSDANIGAGCRCAQHGQRKDRSEKCFHGSLLCRSEMELFVFLVVDGKRMEVTHDAAVATASGVLDLPEVAVW
jgi:hypothetical protein